MFALYVDGEPASWWAYWRVALLDTVCSMVKQVR